MNRSRAYLVLIIGTALIGLSPLFHPGLYTAHDIWHQVARLYHYSEALKAGIFPPRWVPSLALGMGYPLFYFSYHLPWLVSSLAMWSGLALPISLKLSFAVGYLLAGFGMYFLANLLFRHRLAAFVAAILYLISPYFFVNLYVSAAIGIVYALASFPWLFAGVMLIFQSRYRQGILIATMAAVAGILSHALTFILISLFMGIVVLGLIIGNLHKPLVKPKLLSFLAVGILTLLLGSFYLLPFVAYSPLIKASQGSSGFDKLYLANFVTLKQLLYSRWGYAPISDTAATSDISFQVGIAQWLSLAGLILIIIWKRKSILIEPLPYLIAFSFLVSIFLMLGMSKPIWDLLEKVYSFDYPFRLLTIAVFFGSLASAIVVSSFRGHRRLSLMISLVLILIAFYTNRNHIRVNLYTDIPIKDYVQSEITTNTFHEYMPVIADGSLIKEEPAPLIDPSIPVLSYFQDPRQTSYLVNNPISQTLSLHQLDFPGQTVLVDSVVIKHQHDSRGRLQINLTSGLHRLVITQQTNLLTGFSLIFTLLGLVFMIVILTYRRRR
jgi:hypothetical protein